MSRPRCARGARRARARGPNTSTGPAPAPSPRRPSRTASAAICFARRAASSGSSPSASCGGERRRVGAARAVRRAVGVALTRDLDRRSPSKNRSLAVSRCPPVTTTAPGPSAWIGAGELLRVRCPRPPPGSPPRAGSGSSPSPSAAAVVRSASSAPSSSSRAPLSAIITGSSTTGARGRGRARRRPLSIVSARAEHADLDGVDADVVGHRPHLLDDRFGRKRVDAGHRHGVLGGHGGDRRHAVHPAARESLQVGLDAGPAAGVGAGDREDASGCARGRHRPPG